MAASLVVPVIGTPPVVSTSVASTTGVDSAAGGSNLTFTTLNLGAGGGRYSRAEAVSGTVVVGWLRTAAGDFHAFAYNLAAAEPVMQDLGTLGEDANSEAVAVDGTIIVGETYGASVGRRAFAYDLAAAEPVMVDLGTLGGPYSRATDVDGSIVVGVSATSSYTGDPEYQTHAFAYDIAAGEPTMTDLGTLGGDGSIATSVDGAVVVGWSYTATNPPHAFAYDLGAAEPVMQDLGTLDGDSYSQAIAVDNGVVVGQSAPTGRYYPSAFADDVTGSEPAMRDFSTLGSAKSWATGIAGDVVVGGWRRGWPLSRITKHAFAHDLAADDPRSLVLGSWRGSIAGDIDGNVVVGANSYGSRTQYATAWVLRETTGPMLGFRRFERQVVEGVGRVTVRVERYGSTDRAVTVRYRTRSDTASAGKDFVSTSGELRFAPGVTSRSFTLKILNDRRAEKNEDLVLTLSRPSRPVKLGSPSWTEVRITRNDR